MAGQIDGTATGFELLYSSMLMSAIVPLKEPAAVDLRARLKADIKPSELQRLLQDNLTIPTSDEPDIAVEEVDDEEVIMRVTAVPDRHEDGPKLADEVLAAIGEVTSAHDGHYAGAR